MKYLEKLENFINDLDKDYHYLGSQCCGSCALARHKESGHQHTFFIRSDDFDNKPGLGVELDFIAPMTHDLVRKVFQLAKNNNLSAFLSYGIETLYINIGVYSKRGKQEYKVWEDHKLIESKVVNSLV